MANFITPSPFTSQADHGFINPQPEGFSQRTNSHRYDPDRDIIGCINSIKPQNYTTIYVTVNYKTSAPMEAGQWIVLDVLLSTRDWKGLPPRKFYSRPIAIGNDKPARDVSWQQTTWTFKGFPTQAQFIGLYIIRRAKTMGGDFGAIVPATQNLYVDCTTLSFGGHSNAPATISGGYGTGYGADYGEQL